MSVCLTLPQPENLLYDDEGRPKLADFGWAVHGPPGHSRRHTFCGTLEYLAPEMLEEGSPHDVSVDVWSLGVRGPQYGGVRTSVLALTRCPLQALAYEFLYGTSPFATKSEPSTMKRIQDVDLRHVHSALWRSDRAVEMSGLTVVTVGCTGSQRHPPFPLKREISSHPCSWQTHVSAAASGHMRTALSRLNSPRSPSLSSPQPTVLPWQMRCGTRGLSPQQSAWTRRSVHELHAVAAAAQARAGGCLATLTSPLGIRMLMGALHHQCACLRDLATPFHQPQPRRPRVSTRHAGCPRRCRWQAAAELTAAWHWAPPRRVAPHASCSPSRPGQRCVWPSRRLRLGVAWFRRSHLRPRRRRLVLAGHPQQCHRARRVV